MQQKKKRLTTKRIKARKRRIRKAKRIACAVIILIADLIGGVIGAVKKRPWIIGFALAGSALLMTCLTAEKGQEKGNMIGEKVQAEEVNIYGCDMIGEYDYPFNTMSQDWSAEDVEGFYYHEISDGAKAAGGTMPVIVQVYTYIVCREYGVDYEIVFALIERESLCRWDITGDDGESVGYMQIQERWHKDRMERLGVTDLKNPFQNIRVGVDYMAELLERTGGDNMDMLAAYNYGYAGAKRCLWDEGVHEYSYNTEIMERARQLKAETAAGKAAQWESEG